MYAGEDVDEDEEKEKKKKCVRLNGTHSEFEFLRELEARHHSTLATKA
ncbi:MAG: hypothetical protein IJ580_00900 [Prevotella sp.]|nr:hypothetical protein [Prevotella sp.]MBR1556833.1 hypothetical protein [Prevotella sp.]